MSTALIPIQENCKQNCLNVLKNKYHGLPQFVQKMKVIMASELLFLPQHFTLTQKRLVAYAIGLITKNHRDMCPDEFLKTKFVIHAKYFQEAFQLGNVKNGDTYRDLKEAVDLFMREVGVLKLSNSDKNYCKFIWVQQCNYIESEGKIELYFSSLITDFLINFTGTNKYYVNYSLFISHALRSQYAIRLYEILQTRQDTNCLIMSLQKFKTMFELEDSIKPSQIRSKILERAKKELNTKLDLGFDFELNKNNSYDGGYQLIISAKRNDKDIMKMLNFEEGTKYLTSKKQK
jgi:replicase